MTISSTRSAAFLGVAGLGIMLALTACSSSSSGNGGSSSPTPASTSPSMVLPPIPVTKAESITVKVGQTLNVVTPNVTKVTTDNPKVLQVSQPHSDGSAEFNGGAKVVGVGKANLTVFGGVTNLEMYSVSVNAVD